MARTYPYPDDDQTPDRRQAPFYVPPGPIGPGNAGVPQAQQFGAMAQPNYFAPPAALVTPAEPARTAAPQPSIEQLQGPGIGGIAQEAVGRAARAAPIIGGAATSVGRAIASYGQQFTPPAGPQSYQSADSRAQAAGALQPRGYIQAGPLDEQTRFNNLVRVSKENNDPSLFPKQADFPNAYPAYIQAARNAGAPAPAAAAAVPTGPVQTAATRAPATNRVAQLKAAAEGGQQAPAGPIEPKVGAYNEQHGVYYHGNGRWYPEAPPSAEDQRVASVMGAIAAQLRQIDPYRRLGKVDPETGMGDHGPIIQAIASQVLQGKYGVEQQDVAGQYGLQREGMQGEASTRNAGISAGATIQATRERVAGDERIADKQIKAGRYTGERPVVVDVPVLDANGQPAIGMDGNPVFRKGLADPTTGRPLDAQQRAKPDLKMWLQAQQAANPKWSAEALRQKYRETYGE
jgi:hypothetical protein